MNCPLTAYETDSKFVISLCYFFVRLHRHLRTESHIDIAVELRYARDIQTFGSGTQKVKGKEEVDILWWLLSSEIGSSQEEELIYSDNTHAKEIRRHDRPYNNQPKKRNKKPIGKSEEQIRWNIFDNFVKHTFRILHANSHASFACTAILSAHMWPKLIKLTTHISIN